MTDKGDGKAISAEVKKLYEPDFFYEHGDNPANKRFLELAKANIYGGQAPEYRSYIWDNKARFLMARNFDDLMQRDFKIYTAPRALIAMVISTSALINGRT